jgi:hypothetical protein
MKLGFFGGSLLFIAAPALAAVDANHCVSRSMQLKASKRDAFIESCMAQVSSPANIKEVGQQNKTALCEQNARNQHLQGSARSKYISKCMTANEAAVAAKAASSQASPAPRSVSEKSPLPKAAPKSAASNPEKSAERQRSKKSCEQRATGLKGDEHKRFMKRCKKQG